MPTAKYEGPMCAPGHDRLEMLAKGVTPIPVATRTACWLLKMVLEGALWGPEM